MAFGQFAHAQGGRISHGFFVKGGVGLADYTGDFPNQTVGHPLDFQELMRGSGIPVTVTGEAGYHFSAHKALVLGFQGGNYPAVGYAGPTIADSYRYTPQLLGRYSFGASDEAVRPYVDVGVNVTFGGDTPPTSTGWGPSLGGGLDVFVSRSVSFFVESRFNFVEPDDAADGSSGAANGSILGPFDMLNQLIGFGLKISLSGSTGPSIAAIRVPETVMAGQIASFTARMDAPANQRGTYRWEFGDGSTATGQTVPHTYAEPGTYEVTFVATSDNETANRTTSVTVTRPPQPPRVVSLDGPLTVRPSESASFSAEVNDDASRPLRTEWQFGDGDVASGRTARHTFADPGRHIVAFTARNEVGTARDTLVVEVEGSSQRPRIISIDVSPNPVAAKTPVRFGSRVEGGGSVTHHWAFGDGDTGTGASPTHRYAEAGRYTASVQVKNDGGADSDTVTVRVTPARSGGWTIVVASMRRREGAEEMARTYRQRVTSDAFPVRIETATLDQGNRHRVLVGRYETAEAARRAIREEATRLPDGAWIYRLK